MAALGPEDSIIGIDKLGGQWLVTTAHFTVNNFGGPMADHVTVWQGKSGDFHDLTSIKLFALKTPNLVRPRADGFNGSYFVDAYPDLWKLDTSTMQWQSITPPEDVSSFNVSRNSGVVAAFYARGIFSKVFISNDMGATWKKVDRPPYVITDVHFSDMSIGATERWNSSAFSGVMELWKYDSNADNWSKFSEAPHLCNRALYDDNGQARFCLTSGASILRAADDKWVAEYLAE